MTTKRTAPSGAQKRRSKSPGEAALARAFAEQRRTVLTRDVFLKSKGPPVVEVDLPNLGATVLMRRVDLLGLARRGADYSPFRSQVYSIIRDGGLKDPHMEGEGLADTLDLAERVALDTIVVAPEAYVEAVSLDDDEHAALLEAWQEEIEAARKAETRERTAGRSDAADAAAARLRELLLSPPERPTTHVAPVLQALDPDALRPLFVEEGEEPEPGQLLYRRLADADEDMADEPDASGDVVSLHPADLAVILRAAHKHGPGAMGRQFRGSEFATAPVGAVPGVGERRPSP